MSTSSKKKPTKQQNRRVIAEGVIDLIKKSVDIDSAVPGWRDMPMNKIEKVASSILQSPINSVREIEDTKKSTPKLDFLAKRGYYNPEFRNSKFYKMSPNDLIDYAGVSNENRREVRNMLAKNYEWFMKNAPNGLIKAIVTDVTEFRKSLKKDPFDYYGIEAERIKRSEELLKGSVFAKIGYFLLWSLAFFTILSFILISLGI